jgi:hypothetical protein
MQGAGLLQPHPTSSTSHGIDVAMDQPTQGGGQIFAAVAGLWTGMLQHLGPSTCDAQDCSSLEFYRFEQLWAVLPAFVAAAGGFKLKRLHAA